MLRQSNQSPATQKKTDLSVSYTLNYADIELGKELGVGGFGVVYQATWRHNEVAVKKLLMDKISADSEEEFQNESQVMAQLRSPNIVQFYGYCVTPNYCIVMEYMPKGSLFKVLRDRSEPLDWSLRVQIALDIAKGLTFLHHENILHRDIKSLNVLLDKHYQAKLTDFGLSKLKAETKSHAMATKTTNDSVGTVAWMAPELFEGRKVVYTNKSDIYSLGVTFWELASRQIPFKDASNPNLIPVWVQKGEREDIPRDCPARLAELIQQCWDASPDKRPDSNTVVKQLKAIQPTALNTTAASSEPLDTANTSAVHSTPLSGPLYGGNFDSNLPKKPIPPQKPTKPSSMSASLVNQPSVDLPTEIKAIEELLKVASIHEKKEKQDKAQESFTLAIEKADVIEQFEEAMPVSGKAYGLYGEYLIRQNKTSEGEKNLRIASNFGFVRTPQSPANTSNNNNNQSPLTFSPPAQSSPPPTVAVNAGNNNNNQSPLTFSPPAKAAAVAAAPPAAKLAPTAPTLSVPAMVSAADVKKFLTHVAFGEQPEAEAMLKANKQLALAPGDITDCANRTFKNITAFQYAVWALDWHMWTMLRQHLTPEATREQLQGAKNGSWVSQHGTSVSWQGLVDAQQKAVDLYDKSDYTKGNEVWIKEVGAAQRALPMHLINEYCHPTRKFHPCPDFTTGEVLPRSRKVEEYRDSKWVETDWSSATYNQGKLGETFGFVRGSYDKARVGVWWWAGRGGAVMNYDRLACHTLLSTRAQQRDQLLTEVLKDRAVAQYK